MWAAALLLAARLGRAGAEEARLDVRQLQRRRQRNRALSKELVAARERWLAAEEVRAAVEDARRVEEAAARAKEEARRKQEEQRRYAEAAAREAERVRQEQEMRRKAYDEEQARLDAEYQARVEQERRVIEEQRAAAQAAEEARRREEAARRAREEEERRARQEAEERERQEAIRRKLEERRALEKQKKQFAFRLDGSVSLSRPPRGTLLPGPVEREATLRAALVAGTLLGGSREATVDYAGLPEATEALVEAAAQQCRAACDAYATALRLRGMAGEGPLQWMEDPELQHWLAVGAARGTVAAAAACEAALGSFQCASSSGAGGSSGGGAATFEVRTQYGVLPADHAQYEPAVLDRAVALIEAGDAAAALAALEEQLEAGAESFLQDLLPLPAALAPHAAPLGRLLGGALVLAHLLGRMLHTRPAKTSDAPAWFEGAAELMRRRLRELAAGAPKDTLELPALVLRMALGPTNPVAAEVTLLAEANLSPAVRKAREERERQRQVELAARLLEEEWPDVEEIKAARLADAQAKTPVPERVWALRNVARTLALSSDPAERGRARRLLEQAVLLKQQWAGAPDHPCVLPELLALADVLARGGREWEADAAGVSALLLRVLGSVAAAYEKASDRLSAAILQEAALRRCEEALGPKHPAVVAATRRADALVDGLSPEQRSAAAAYRTRSDAVLTALAGALTEELGAYQGASTAAQASKVQQWDERGVALVGPLAQRVAAG